MDGYVVIGLDKTEYGPIDLQLLQDWVNKGHVSRLTSVRNLADDIHTFAQDIAGIVFPQTPPSIYTQPPTASRVSDHKLSCANEGSYQTKTRALIYTKLILVIAISWLTQGVNGIPPVAIFPFGVVGLILMALTWSGSRRDPYGAERKSRNAHRLANIGLIAASVNLVILLCWIALILYIFR